MRLPSAAKLTKATKDQPDCFLYPDVGVETQPDLTMPNVPYRNRNPQLIGRKNYLFAGSDAGGSRAAALYSLIETAKLNGVNPQHYLADLLARIADHPARQIAELLPWNWKPLDLTRSAA